MNWKRYRKALFPLIPAAVIVWNTFRPEAAVAEQEVVAWFEQWEALIVAAIALSGPVITYFVPNDGTT